MDKDIKLYQDYLRIYFPVNNNNNDIKNNSEDEPTKSKE